MNKKQKAFDDAFEIILTEAAELAAEELGEECKECEYTDKHKPSPELDAKIKKLFRRERRKAVLKKAAVIAKRAACVLVVLIAAFAIAIGSVEAWRVKFLNYVFDPEKPNMEIVFGDKGTYYSDDDIIIKYLPLGFELTEKLPSRKSVTFTFELQDSYISVTRFDKDIRRNVDTEGATVEDIVINDYDGIYIEKEGFKLVTWSDGDYMFSITANVSKKELIRVAESIRY